MGHLCLGPSTAISSTAKKSLHIGENCSLNLFQDDSQSLEKLMQCSVKASAAQLRKQVSDLTSDEELIQVVVVNSKEVICQK